MDSIKVENLVKQFNGFTAVDHISFRVPQGEIFGLLGPNGAGKTTTINLLSTLLKPTSGSAKVSGHDIFDHRDEVRKNIGIVFQEPALDNQLTGRENLTFHAMMYGINKDERRKRIKRVVELVELTPKIDVLVDHYSGGMKRRLEIARGLIHRPKVLFLDEPTLGLDTQTRRHIWDYIKKLNRENQVTIILTTHYMEEADYLCDRVAIIDHGKIVALDTPDQLKEMLGGDVISLELDGRVDDLMAVLKNLEWVNTMKKHGDHLNLTVETAEKRIPEIITTAQKIGVVVRSVNLHKPSLEDVFLHFTGKTIREQEVSQIQRNRETVKRRMHR
ncbi:daunorubicin/doxorubicin resistance ATP-binding protein DrrA [bacterium BMS3Abin05]|nr:daunorubicin/doxorubicin resistance ATP-binding protein DrrA [bacterium BMS3Abin05]GBE28161.1 daunorubicin/doxorubicin resistance ATP-binding protein DrrA [bacterium BMS3Bbin03]HDZ10579.1 ATP-binding cassette domain-containing protein [Bacteroidota bacterium]